MSLEATATTSITASKEWRHDSTAQHRAAADIDAFIKTGAPTADLPHSSQAPNISRLAVERGNAAVVVLGR